MTDCSDVCISATSLDLEGITLRSIDAGLTNILTAAADSKGLFGLNVEDIPALACVHLLLDYCNR